ncbi:MAG: hypothetical protein IJF15_00380 [Oscillospiraceae bacterium]|nr:hypothetical protein [Oscillospiraceae bacterium]
MKNTSRRLLATALIGALAAGMCVSASAFDYPKSYWPLQEAWIAADAEKNTAEIISVAQKTYDLLMPLGLGEQVCYNLEPKCATASWCCEMRGDIAGAITWLERQRVCAEWLHENIRDYKDALLSIDSRIAYLKAAKDAEVYALTDQKGLDYTAAGAAASGTLYGSVVEGDRKDESSVLMYVTFGDTNSVDYWVNYHRNTSFKFAEALDGGVIEFAWNFAAENTAGAQMVLDPAYDSYITESLAALGGLDATILLRVGAEMSVWAECDPQTYISAFRKIANAADRYSNIKMVFSPNDVSNRNVTFSDFYPGDNYVDWIGMSTYHNTNFAGDVTSYDYDAVLYGVDAYYGKGLYDNDPLVVIAPIVEFAAAHNKPVMISECGFSYRNESTGADQTAYAVDQLNKFYSYVNMIYPQVKAVFYFNTTLGTLSNAYALDENAAVANAYRTAIDQNGAYLAAGETNGKTWKPLSDVVSQGEGGKLRLATYAIFPAKTTAQVTYYVDGAQYAASSTVPYYCDLNLSALGDGVHTVRAEAKGGAFSGSSVTYELSVSGGKATISSKAPKPVEPAPKPPVSTNTAYASTQNVEIDGKAVEVQAYALKDANGNPTNYVKLRDVALLLNGSAAQFEVSWDGAVNIVTGQTYTANGSEMFTPFSGDRSYTIPTAATKINGAAADLAAITLTDDAGGGYTYYQLRDLGRSLGFNVGWSAERGIYVETDKAYVG